TCCSSLAISVISSSLVVCIMFASFPSLTLRILSRPRRAAPRQPSTGQLFHLRVSSFGNLPFELCSQARESHAQHAGIAPGAFFLPAINLRQEHLPGLPLTRVEVLLATLQHGLSALLQNFGRNRSMSRRHLGRLRPKPHLELTSALGRLRVGVQGA